MVSIVAVPLQSLGVPILPAIGVSIAAAMFGVAFLRRLRAKNLESVGLDSTRDAVAGSEVRLEGDVSSAGTTVEAPFSGEECLGYVWSVQERERRERENQPDTFYWDTKESGSVAEPFLLGDDDGTVLVQPSNLDLEIVDDGTNIVVEGGDEPPQEVREFITETDSVGSEDISLDLGFVEIGVGDKRRYVEQRLELGETAFVSGVAESAAANDAPAEADAVVTGEDRGLIGRLVPGPVRLVRDEPLEDVTRERAGDSIQFFVFGMCALVPSLVFWAI